MIQNRVLTAVSRAPSKQEPPDSALRTIVSFKEISAPLSTSKAFFTSEIKQPSKRRDVPGKGGQGVGGRNRRGDNCILSPLADSSCHTMTHIIKQTNRAAP